MHIAAYSRCEWVAARSCLEPLIRTVICVKTSEAGPLIVVTHHDTLCVEARGGADVIVTISRTTMFWPSQRQSIVFASMLNRF